MYSLMTFMQSELINSWTVIDESAEVVFSWSKQQISLFQVSRGRGGESVMSQRELLSKSIS